MFYRDIHKLGIFSCEDLDFDKTKTKETVLPSRRQYHKNPQQNLSKDELAASASLIKYKYIIIQKFDKGNSVATDDTDKYIKRMEKPLND